MPQTMMRNLYSGGSLRRGATFTKRAFAAESFGPPRLRAIRHSAR